MQGQLDSLRRNLMLGFVASVLLALGFAQVHLHADRCGCVQCSCVQLCCDLSNCDNGVGTCDMDPDGCGYFCGDGDGAYFDCGDYC